MSRLEEWCWENRKGACFVYSNCRALQWLRRLLNGLSLRGPRTVHVRFVAEKVALDRLFSEYFGFFLSVSCNQCFKIFMYALLLREVKTVEAREPSKKPRILLWKSDRKLLSISKTVILPLSTIEVCLTSTSLFFIM